MTGRHQHAGAYSPGCPECRDFDREACRLDPLRENAYPSEHAHFGAYSHSCSECRRWERGLVSAAERDDQLVVAGLRWLWQQVRCWTAWGQLIYWTLALVLVSCS